MLADDETTGGVSPLLCLLIDGTRVAKAGNLAMCRRISGEEASEKSTQARLRLLEEQWLLDFGYVSCESVLLRCLGSAYY